MSLQTDKRDLELKLSRYMTLLSNLSSPPAEYINDVDYLRGLVQIADQKEFQGLEQTWETIRPKDARSIRYIETGVLNGGRVLETKSILGLADDILALRGGPIGGKQ